MDKKKQEILEAAGWKVGTADEFLGLLPEESAYLDIRLALAAGLRQKRLAAHLTQVQLARRIKSSQSRLAKMEAGDPTVSMDLLIRTLLSLGVTRQDLATIIA